MSFETEDLAEYRINQNIFIILKLCTHQELEEKCLEQD